jgi:predicted DCC family thiol-disulfide oxidoreductase YuxK
MRALSIEKDKETLHSGVDAFLKIWKELPYYKFLAKVVEVLPFSKPILQKMYQQWVLHRLRTDPRFQTCDKEKCKPKM